MSTKNGILQKEFENAVFDNPAYFLAKFAGGRDSVYVREEFPSPQAAMARALQLTDEYGRGGIVYAVAQDGHFIVLDREDWAAWLERWFSNHPEQRMRKASVTKLVSDANAPRNKRQAIAAQRSRP